MTSDETGVLKSIDQDQGDTRLEEILLKPSELFMSCLARLEKEESLAHNFSFPRLSLKYVQHDS